MSKKILNIIKKIEPLNRYNVSPDLDDALKILKQTYPNLKILKYKSGQKVWDWEVPKKWKIIDAYIEYNEKKIFDIKDHPLRVWSGSWSVNKKNIYFDQLKKNIFSKPKLKNSIPWKYKYYFHNKDFWGFSLSQKEYLKLKKLNGPFNVVIDTKFYKDYLNLGELFLKGKKKDCIIISSDICHPGQVNDSLSGVFCALKLYDYLKNKKPNFSYIFTFQPEMIGTIAYLANQKNLEKFKYGIFTEMMGTKGPMTMQRSFHGKTNLDLCAINTIKNKYKNKYFKIKTFLNRGIINDELILNHAKIPSIALNRGPFSNYHTSADNLKNISPKILSDSFDTLKKIILNFDNVQGLNVTQNNQSSIFKKKLCYKKKFMGPIFLDKHNLYVDWQEDLRMNTIIDKIMMMLSGEHSVEDMQKFCKCKKNIILNFLKKLKRKNIISEVYT